MMRTFNPFAFFYYACAAELDSTVSYLRDCVNTHEWEERGTSRGDEPTEAEPVEHPIEEMRRRAGSR